MLEVLLQWAPVVDNIELFDQPIFLLTKGQMAPVPMIVVSILETTVVYYSLLATHLQGTTSEEGIYMIYQIITSSVTVS